MIKKPLIGITLDAQGPGGYANAPWYAIRENYCTNIAEAGGIPFPLTHNLNLVETYLSLIDGLLITGGGHDVDPTLYGVRDVHPTVTLNPQRTTFEMAMANASLEKDLPLLGICGGQQLINVVLGGTLIQHIPDEVPEGLQHKQDHYMSSHQVQILKETLLHQIVKTENLAVNSVHHQAVKDPGRGVVINAIAPDGVIEGLEAPAYRFCLGLQWHPEFIVTSQEAGIFQAFIEAARG